MNGDEAWIEFDDVQPLHLFSPTITAALGVRAEAVGKKFRNAKTSCKNSVV